VAKIAKTIDTPSSFGLAQARFVRGQDIILFKAGGLMLSGSAFRTSSSTNVVPPAPGRRRSPAAEYGKVRRMAHPLWNAIALGAEPSRVFSWFEPYQGASASLYDHV